MQDLSKDSCDFLVLFEARYQEVGVDLFIGDEHILKCNLNRGTQKASGVWNLMAGILAALGSKKINMQVL